MNSKLSHLLQKIGFYLLIVAVFILPVFFLPITSEYYEFNKQVLLVIISGFLLVILSGCFITGGGVRLTRSPLGLPILFILTSWLLSTYLRTPNRADAFFEPGQSTTIIALVIFFFSTINLIRTKKELDLLVNALLGSSLLLSVVTLLWSSGLITNLLPNNFLKSVVWSPTGSAFTTLVFLAFSLVFTAILAFKNRQQPVKLLTFSSLLLVFLISSGLLAFRLFRPGSNFRPIFLPQSVSWSIALKSMEISPLWGTGPATYLSDFTRFKPASFNLNKNWAIRFSSSSNYYLQIIATLGLIGLATYLFLGYKLFQMFTRVFRTSSESPLQAVAFSSTATALILLVSLLFFNPGLIVQLFLFVLLAISIVSFKLMGSSLVHEANIDIIAASDSGTRSPILPWVALIVSIALIAPASFYGYRFFLGDYYFNQALQFAAQNQAQKTYDFLIKAFTTNPQRDSYRVAYSQTNILLANSIAGQPDLTADQRNTVTQLIQQAIREAKNAVTLNPAKVSNVENLANTYRNLIGVAQGADAWTVAAYRQAILLDPTNPNDRIILGGIYYGLKNYDEAIRLFQQAVDLNPNLPNAYYNLSAAYREKGELQNALAAMQVVTSKLDPNSSDYTKASAELEDLRKKVGQTTQTAAPVVPAQTQLEAPKPLPSPRITPPIKLPADLGPESTPAPSPAVTPAPTPAPTQP